MQSNVNYELQEIIGEGAMAVVYKARHRELDSFHAIKKLKVQDFDVQKRLIQEGKLLARIRHPNILSVTDLVKLDGVPSLVMEYIQGPSLAAVLSKFDINEKQIDALARGIMNGVMAAHKKGLIHRDLKPGNILIDIVDGMVIPKVADFGLAKILHSSQPILPQTRSGVTMGTPAYMAPEQIRHFGSVDERADIFSLGIILYELVTGKGCFLGGNTMEIWEHICNGKYVLPEEINASIPIRMKRTIEKALLVDREQRFSSVQEMLDCWCTDEEDEYVPLLSKDERGFWPKDLLDRMMVDKEEDANADETLDFSEQIDIAPLLNMVQELDHIRSKKMTSLPLSIHETAGDNLAPKKRNQDQRYVAGLFGLVIVGVLALGMLFWNDSSSKNDLDSQNVVLDDASENLIADSLLNPFDASSKPYALFEKARDRLLKGEYYHACSLSRTLIKDHGQHAAVFALTGVGEFLRGNTLESQYLLQKAEMIALQNENPNTKLYRVDRAIVTSEIKELQQDPLALLFLVLSNWSAHEQRLVDELVSFQQSFPTSIAFVHLELRHHRETGDWKEYDKKVQRMANVYTSSAALQMEYALRQRTNNPKEVEERLTHLQKTDTSNVDLSLYLANFFAIQGDEHLRMQQFVMSLGDTVSQQEQMRFISAHAKVLASVGRIFESEKLWNFCMDGFSAPDLVQLRAQCALDALESLHTIEPSTIQQKWMDSLSRSISSQYLPAEWRFYYSVMLRASKGTQAILSNDQGEIAKIEQEFINMSDSQTPFVHVSSVLAEFEQQKVLRTYNQKAQHQYIQEKYEQRLPICAEIMTAASIADQSNLSQRAKQWRESFLMNRCSFQFPELLINKAQIHVDLANDFAQQNESERAKEHLQTFFRLWNTADKHLPLYKKAQKISDTLGI